MHVYMQHHFSPHHLAQQTRPGLQPAIDLAARPRAVRSARPEIHASVPWLTPSLRCARRNLLQASPRECCTTAVLPCCRRDSAERKIVAGPLYRAACAWPLHLQTLFSLSFPAFPEVAAAAYFFFARPLPPSDPIQVTLGPQWAHLRPPTATLRTRGLPPPTTVPR